MADQMLRPPFDHRAMRLFSVAVAMTALMGTFLLGMGEGDYRLTVLVACTAFAAVVISDWLGFFRLSPLLANVAGVLALVWAAYDFMGAEAEGKLLAIADLLVYLQVVLFFQEKSPRVYGHILLLGFLQVVVGAALSLAPYFGLGLAIYAGLGVFCAHLFFVLQAKGLMEGPVNVASSQLKGRVSGQLAPGAVFETRAHEFRPQQLLVTSVKAGIAAAPIALVVFLVVPRMGYEPWRAGSAAQVRVQGFSEEVRLGEFGDVFQNPEIVMRVKFVDPKTGQGVKLATPPMLRGSVVTKYHRGTWSHHHGRFHTDRVDLMSLPEGSDHVLQEISVEPLSESVLFSIFPAFAIGPTRAAWDIDKEQIVRDPERLKKAKLDLVIATVGIDPDTLEQRRFTPILDRISETDLYRHRLLPLDSDRQHSLSTLYEAAERAVSDAGVDPRDSFAVCNTLERYLKEDGGFSYTLAAQPRDPGLDPIEDFIANNRKGHCEYFASALALMLRHFDIPTRVVIGYQGGEWNSVGRFYQFRQLHTHSWVEAYLPRRQLEQIDPRMRGYRRGAWFRLDPTAASLEPQAQQGVLQGVKEARDFAAFVWTKYVIGMDRKRQDEALFEPLAEIVRGLLDPATFVSTLRVNLRRFFANVWAWLKGNWFSWQGGLIAVAICSMLVVWVYALRSAWRWWRRLWGDSDAVDHQQESDIAFYRQWESLLARYGFRRKPQQTQMSFAASMDRMQEKRNGSPVAAISRSLVDAFYRVRFGGRSVSPNEQQRIDNDLQHLAETLQGSSK